MFKNNSINFMGDLIVGDQPVIYGFGFDSTWHKKEYEGVFDGVSDALVSVKYNVANFEAIIRKRDNDNMSVSEWSMCCGENICNELKRANINIVSVANNHTMDYGRSWFDYTVKILTDNGIEVVGLKDKPYIKIDIDGKKIAIIAASYLRINNREEIGYFYQPSEEDWRRVIKECSDCQIKIAYLHWGSEFIVMPTESQKTIAEGLINLGINVIVGHHPHILQSKGQMGDVPVIYSLGNFVSDYWQKRLRKTEIVNFDMERGFTSLPCKINDKGCPELVANAIPIELVYNENNEKESVFINRMRMRLEYLIKILFNFYKIKEKRKFLKWIYRRVVYVLRYSFEEIKNPNIIYEKYKN